MVVACDGDFYLCYDLFSDVFSIHFKLVDVFCTVYAYRLLIMV